MKVYHWIIAVLAVLLIGVTGFFGFQVYQDFYQNSDLANEEESNNEEEQQVKELSEEKFEKNDDEDLNPFGDSTPHTNLTNNDYQEYIHQMSHQKVEAEEKWGFYLITAERIKWLLDGLNKVDLGEKETTYQSILERWNNNDYSRVDKDHNAIWRMQGGTIGRATDILSESEEEAFINSKE
ncbi:DUF6241 domain-containing protein [Paraliobacillus salinarum]|uniref:DUF6241 domain-containing protein n=1 Tax=Paraliobacillus salinarum TaxID=1158996 RepID=UPI0015F48DD0|nr:DUF6241 domain-containing protein [Paraliobacillus salinarum]